VKKAFQLCPGTYESQSLLFLLPQISIEKQKEIQ
jgi:hypothetical protein